MTTEILLVLGVGLAVMVGLLLRPYIDWYVQHEERKREEEEGL
jgi:hypothetical protein